MINHVLKKVSSQVNNSRLYREKFEFALNNLDKILLERRMKAVKQSFDFT